MWSPMEGNTLEPVVIAPISFKLDAFKYRHFSCRGNGILCNNIAFDPDLREAFSADGHEDTKSGDPRRPRYKPDYWRAQCAFRGLPYDVSVMDMQLALRTFLDGSPLVTDARDASLLPTFENLRHQYDNLFLQQNIEARARMRIPQDYGNEEAERNSSIYLDKRFVDIERFPDSDFNPTTLVALKVSSATRAHLHQQAGQMGLFHKSVSVDLTSFNGPTRYIVIGYRRAVVRRAVDWLEGKPDEYRLVTSRRIQSAANSIKDIETNALTRSASRGAARRQRPIGRNHPSIPGFITGVGEAERQRSIRLQGLDRWELEKQDEE